MTDRGLAASIMIMLGFLATGCQTNPAEPQDKPAAQTETKNAPNEVTLSTQAQTEQKITIAPVEGGMAILPQRAKGRIALPDNASWRVGVLAEGRVEDVYFNLGDLVKKGQVLARMHSHDVHEARAAYANARAEQSRLEAAEALAQKNYDRSRRLYELKAEALAQTEIARQEVTNAQAAVREAGNNVLREEAHLSEILGLQPNPSPGAGENADLIPIVAPADGQVIQKNVTPGATISMSTDAFVIGDLRRLWMLASVDAATLAKLHRGQRATISISDVPDATYSGTVTNLGQEFDPVTRLIQVRIEVQHPDSRLRPEMLANAEFAVGSGTPTLLVPQEAVQQVNGQDVVFVRIGPDRFRVQVVELGAIVQRKVRILQGLHQGEQVIARGSFTAKGQLLKASIGE